VSFALDAEYSRLIDQLIDVGREIAAYRTRLKSADGYDWHQELEPILDRHRAVTARLREVAGLRATL
jgi:hypothetical protein